MTKLVLSQQTKDRCKIFPGDHPILTTLREVSIENVNLLVGVPERIEFSIYLRLPDQIVEFIKPGELSKKLVESIEGAIKKTTQVLICIDEKYIETFRAIVNNSSSRRLLKLQGTQKLDYAITKTYDVLSQVSRSITNEGLNPETLKRAETAINEVVTNLIDNKNTLQTLNKIIALDPALYDHSTMVSIICSVIAAKLNFKSSPEMIAKEMARCGLFHDVGKVKISPEILNKPGKLTSEEFDEIKKHPEYGKQELETSELPKIVTVVAFQHHERFEGYGYPLGKKGRYEESQADGIHVFSRICTIADVYSALIMKRAYKDAYSPEQTIETMLEMSGHFDPKLLGTFIDALIESVMPPKQTENSIKNIDYRNFLKGERKKIVC